MFFDDAIEKRKAKKETRFIVPVKHTKYIVVPHPEPEKIKTIFSYDRFPSILDTLHEEEIHLLLLEEGEEDDALLDYIDE